jgi:excisionase family DNA binding protein
MPSTRTKSRRATRRPASQVPSEVLTLAEAAAYLRLSEDDVLRLVREQRLPARQLGSEWRFLRPAINDWLRAGPALSNKEAWDRLEEHIKAHPWEDVDELREQIERNRMRLEQDLARREGRGR